MSLCSVVLQSCIYSQAAEILSTVGIDIRFMAAIVRDPLGFILCKEMVRISLLDQPEESKHVPGISAAP